MPIARIDPVEDAQVRRPVGRAARLVDCADEVQKMVLAKFMRAEGRDFWSWSAGNRV